jgi:ribonuclease P protein component
MNRSRRAVGRYIVLHGSDRPNDSSCAIAIIASRRVGNAVQRNRAKRLIRAALSAVPLAGGSAVVVVARAACARARMSDVAEELVRLAAQCDVEVCENVA